MKKTIIILALFSWLLNGFSQKIYEHSHPHYKAQADEVFLQEISEKITSEVPITAIAVHEKVCYAVKEKRIFKLKGGVMEAVEASPNNVENLMVLDDNIWALTAEGLYRLVDDTWKKIDDRPYIDLCMHLGSLHAATSEDIFRLEGDHFVSLKPEGGYLSSDVTVLMEDGSQVLSDPVRLGPISKMASYSGTLYALRPGKIILFDGQVVDTDIVDWGILPSKNTRDLLSFGSRLFISTDRGLAVLRGAALTTLKGTDGLPYEDTKCLAHGFDNDLWIGTTRGAIRMLSHDEWQYFGADHWLPGNRVNDIAADDKTVYIATDAGIGVIRYEPYTLLKKAAYYERHIKEWGLQRMGFVHTLTKKEGEWIREISDNDGGHTSPYLAAMSFKYAVTGDEEARHEALNSFKAMLWLERITPIPGYPARAIYSLDGDKGEMARHGSGGLPAKWFPSKDGKWMWKGDTSSDEVIAHFYSVSLFHDLVARGKEKELAKQHLVSIATHILENGWILKGMDGKPTRWGRWDPTYLLRPYGYMDRGVNGLEALTFMHTALNLSGDKKFKDGYEQLMKWGYHTNTIRQKNVFPPEHIAPWDDNLAFRSYYTLLRNTDHPALRSVYLRSLARTWEVKRIEEVPWYNYVYGAITGNDCEQQQSMDHLRAWQLDCVEHNFTNSFRHDLKTKKGYVPYESGTRAISPRESVVNRNSRYALVYDGGHNGNRAMEPSAFLRDYWMGRYHGLILAPTTDDPLLIDVTPRTGQQFGAKPYDGPPRPIIK